MIIGELLRSTRRFFGVFLYIFTVSWPRNGKIIQIIQLALLAKNNALHAKIIQNNAALRRLALGPERGR